MRKMGMFRRISVGLLSVALLVGLLPVSGLRAEDADSEVVLRFLVASDIHLDAKTDDKKAKQLKGMFASAYEYAESQTYNKIDAVVLNGDVVNYGYVEEYEALKEVLDCSNIKEETEVLAIMGNHEWWRYTNNGETNLGSTSYLNGIAAVSQIEEKSLNWSKTIGGYQFIGMSQLYNDTFGTDNLNWMSEEVEKAVSSDPSKPVFTFQHLAIEGTVYGSNGGGPREGESAILDGAYAGYRQVINFSGHSHVPINSPTAINQTTYTQYTTGTMYAISTDSSATYGANPPGRDNVGQYTIVEVASDNTVRMIPYDQFTDSRFKSLSGDGTDIEYLIDVNDTANWLYKADTRADSGEAPYFTDDTVLQVSDVTYKSANLTFAQAKDNSGVYAYDIVCTPNTGTTVTYRIFSEWYFQPMPTSLSYDVTGLEAGTTYRIAVYPVDFFDNKGEAIVTDITTLEKQAGDDLVLTFQQVNSDGAWFFDTNNPDLVAGQYYKVPVTIDGEAGHVIISKQGNGEKMCIWANFFGLCGDAAVPKRNIKIEKGVVIREVLSTSWSKEIEGGDAITIGEELYLKQTAGVWVAGQESADDNIVYEPEAYNTNLISYGDCESVKTSDWGTFSNAEYVTDCVHGGNYAIKLTNAGSLAQVRLNLRGIVKNAFYKVSVWVYVGTDAPDITIQRGLFIAVESPWQMLSSSYDTIADKKGEWVQYEFSFQALENANLVQIDFYTSDVGTEFYLDDLEIYRICPHDYMQYVAAKASCKEEGNIEHWSCRTCGAYFADVDGTKEITNKESVKVPATGIHNFEKTIAKADWKNEGRITEVCACGETRITTIPAATSVSLKKSDFDYNKKKQSVTVAVKDSTGKALATDCYTVTGTMAATNPGTYKVTVTLKGEYYQGSQTLTWKIEMKGTTLKSVKAGSKRLTIKWKKQTVGVKGYKIQVSTNKNFKKNVKTITIKKAKTASKTVKNLKAKKKYYVRICTYQGKYTSSWSKVMSTKTKK